MLTLKNQLGTYLDSLRNGKGPNEESIENLEQIDFIEAVENNDFEQSDDVVDHYSNKMIMKMKLTK